MCVDEIFTPKFAFHRHLKNTEHLFRCNLCSEHFSSSGSLYEICIS